MTDTDETNETELFGGSNESSTPQTTGDLAALLGMEGFNYKADLDKADIPHGPYPTVIESVEVRQKLNTEGPHSGEVSLGLMVSTKVDAAGFPAIEAFDKAYMSKFLFLGYGEINRFGLQSLKALASAIEETEATGDFDWQARGLERNSEGKTYLTAWHGRPLGVNWGPEKKNGQLTKRSVILNWIPASEVQPLSEEDLEASFDA